MLRLRALFRTTAFRWSLSIAGGFTAMALVLFGFIYWQTAVHERVRIDAMITKEALAIANGPQSDALKELTSWVTEDLHDSRYAGLFAPDGTHLGGNLLGRPDGLIVDGEARRAVFVGIDRDRDGDDPEVVRAVAMRLSDGDLMIIGYDIDELEDVQDIILRALGLGLLPMVILSLAGGTLLALRAQGRIASIHQAMHRIMRGQLGERLPVRGSGDDLDRLAASVNGMLFEIERLIQETRAIGNNIAHDLRTPLTRVRTRLERGRDESATAEAFQDCIDRAIGSVDQALAVVAAILRIGEIEHGRRKSAFTTVDLTGIAKDAFELYEPLAEEKGVILCLHAEQEAQVFGDRDLLLEAAGNLLDNALKFGPPGTSVTLSVECGSASTALSIRDCGPGIPAAERGKVLQRFYRGEESRTVDGTGLGLSLVSAIVALHGFSLEIGDAMPGCIVRIRFLRAGPDP